MPTVLDIINGAFIDLSVITVNETLTNSQTADSLARLIQIQDALSAEGLAVPNQQMQSFLLTPNITAYTLGAGGSFGTSGGLRAMKVTAWRAFYGGVLQNGGRPLSMAEFGEQSRLSLGQTSAIPEHVGADTSYPLINIRVSPPPSATPGQLELAYWTPLANFVTINDILTLPQGFQRMLRCLLAADLFPQYGRPSLMQLIYKNAADAKAALITENTMAAPQPVPAAPQGQQ
jgi:hypothetical protein